MILQVITVLEISRIILRDSGSLCAIMLEICENLLKKVYQWCLREYVDVRNGEGIM